MDRQRLAQYYQYTTDLEMIRCNLQTQILAAGRKVAELESSLLEEQASRAQLHTLADKLQTREFELQNEVHALQMQNRDCAFKLEEAETRILESTTMWYKEYERAESLQKNLDLATPQDDSKLPLRNFDRPHSAQPSSTNKRSLAFRRGNKNLSVFTKTR